jgi:hypothetical protein
MDSVTVETLLIGLLGGLLLAWGWRNHRRRIQRWLRGFQGFISNFRAQPIRIFPLSSSSSGYISPCLKIYAVSQGV